MRQHALHWLYLPVCLAIGWPPWVSRIIRLQVWSRALWAQIASAVMRNGVWVVAYPQLTPVAVEGVVVGIGVNLSAIVATRPGGRVRSDLVKD